jgi:predicted AlkP superfamily pyrophosphatase or phosphodiesterase
MMRRRFFGVLLCLALVVSAPSAQTTARAPILVLVSFDGWRWDYIDRTDAPNLRALAARGAHATELIPSFPSFTFPNHYTIVTGLYTAHHGIVANDIEEPGFPERFTMSSKTSRDGRWWGGEPIWVTAERQGQRAATMFWPGNEAEIKGVRPTRWWPFDTAMTPEERVAHVLEWLALPEDQRPTCITLYLEDVDHAGHDFGPLSPELMTAAARLDRALGQLLAGVTQLRLDDRTNVVVVSDHGMTSTSEDRIVFLDDYIDLDTVDVVESGEFVQLVPKPGYESAIYQGLHGRIPHVTIDKREDLPARFHYRDNPRIAPILGLVDEGWIVSSHRAEAKRKPDAKPRLGQHGYDPQLRDMHGLFVAAGPAIKPGVVLPPFENIHIYDFLCALLHLTPAPNDGNPAVLRGILRTPS